MLNSQSCPPSLPPCCSPIMLIQIVYKVLFISLAILPLVLEGRWGEVPWASLTVFTAYLPLLVFCAPWAYLLKGSNGGEGVRKKAE